MIYYQMKYYLQMGFAPPLADAWSVLANQPQFATMPLVTAADVVEVGNGEASSILNLINSEIPAQFEGYEVRLFDSLSCRCYPILCAC